jgi:hypothetical protein
MDFSNESAVNALKEIVAYHKSQWTYHRDQSDIAMKKIKELEPDLKSLVISLETRNAYKRGWKQVVEDGLINNVSNILKECHPYFLSINEHDTKFVDKAKNMMGTIDSFKWKNFTLEVIKHLHKKGSFYCDGEFDSFEDTAGGCDEVTQYAAMDLIDNSTDLSEEVNPSISGPLPPPYPLPPIDMDS